MNREIYDFKVWSDTEKQFDRTLAYITKRFGDLYDISTYARRYNGESYWQHFNHDGIALFLKTMRSGGTFVTWDDHKDNYDNTFVEELDVYFETGNIIFEED